MYLIDESQKEGLCEVLDVGGAFHLDVDVLDANHLADGTDGAVAYQTIALRFLLDKELCVSKLAKEVMENWKGEKPGGKYTPSENNNNKST